MKKALILKVKHKKNNTVILVLSLLIVIAGPSGRDVRLKAEHDGEEAKDDRRKNNTVFAGLDPAIEERDVRHKAEHDDYLLVIPRLDRGIQEIPGTRCACLRMTKKT